MTTSLKISLFAFFSVIIGFLVSYATDVIQGKKINWWPGHGREMASGTFISSFISYYLFEKITKKNS